MAASSLQLDESAPPVASSSKNAISSLPSALNAAQHHLGSFSFSATNPLETARIALLLTQASQDESGNTVNDDGAANSALSTQLISQLVNLVKIPLACTIEEAELDAAQSLEKERFLHQLPTLLRLTLSLLAVETIPPDVEFLATRFIAYVKFSPLDPQDQSQTSTSAQEICTALCASPRCPALLRHILSKSFPPLFKPHPRLNPESGRLLSRPRGGDRAMLDWFSESMGDENEGWRKAGMGNVVGAVIRALERSEMEDLWRYILPPILAFLDDYETRNKLIGMYLLSTLLMQVDASLLNRTGAGQIFQQSISSAFSALGSDLTPLLLRQTHLTALELINLLYPSSPLPTSPASLVLSKKRHEALYKLIEEGIIHPWEFKGGVLPIESTILHSLPQILQSLSLASVRYFQIIVPHLTALISFTPPTMATLDLYALAIGGLLVCFEVGAVRMGRYRGLIVGAVGKCWVNLKEEEDGKSCRREDEGRTERLEGLLRRLLIVLGEKDVVAAKVDLPRLRALDPIFADLVR